MKKCVVCVQEDQPDLAVFGGLMSQHGVSQMAIYSYFYGIIMTYNLSYRTYNPIYTC